MVSCTPAAVLPAMPARPRPPVHPCTALSRLQMTAKLFVHTADLNPDANSGALRHMPETQSACTLNLDLHHYDCDSEKFERETVPKHRTVRCFAQTCDVHATASGGRYYTFCLGQPEQQSCFGPKLCDHCMPWSSKMTCFRTCAWAEYSRYCRLVCNLAFSAYSLEIKDPLQH